ncbi:hypothetical protein HI914_06924 [Erysiphe necator]|nr:hypothetical protein HI914_06924 [Erysiphe necator]
MVLTSFVSNIDGTVPSFKDGRWRAKDSKIPSDTTLPLPEQQLKINKVKVSENSKAHLPNNLFVTPILSKISISQIENVTNLIKDCLSQNPSGANNSWSKVARKCHKKS